MTQLFRPKQLVSTVTTVSDSSLRQYDRSTRTEVLLRFRFEAYHRIWEGITTLQVNSSPITNFLILKIIPQIRIIDTSRER